MVRHRQPWRTLAAPAIGGALALVLSACGGAAAPATDRARVDAVEAPTVGACRELAPEDVALPTNATQTVACAQPHTAQTYAVGQLPEELDDAAYDDDAVGEFAYRTCTEKFRSFLGADESMSMRTVVSWAWFRPSEKAWDEGARWYRCDLVGGTEDSAEFLPLPRTAEGLLLGRAADRWMVCAAGGTVAGGEKVPCNAPHDWRAVTTIKLGEPEDPYPGDQLVEVRTRDFCSDSVGAWLNYPIDYDFGYTYFHEAEWQAGNRRSVCWAKTPD